MKTRPVNTIAAEIDTIFRNLPRERNRWIADARPYVNAMLEMTSFKGYYGIDQGVDVGRRFLVNTQYWRGEQARRIKAEINEAIKDANQYASYQR